MKKKTVEIERKEILDLVLCAEDQGFRELWPDFARWLGTVTDKEIDAFAQDLSERPGYGEDDFVEAKAVLHKWRDRYSKK